MSNEVNDLDPGRRKSVTNTDEQEVAVNHSTADEGYDEPAATTPPATTAANSEKQTTDEKGKEKTSEKKTSQANKNF